MRYAAIALAEFVLMVASALLAAPANAQRPSVTPAPRPAVISARAERLVWSPRGDVALGHVSADGRLVPYLSGNDPSGGQWSSRGLFVHDLQTGADRRVTVPRPSDAEGAPSDRWCVCVISPNSSHLAYVWWTGVGTAPRAELRMIRLAAHGIPTPRAIFGGRAGTTPQRAGIWIEPFGWSPDGKWVGAVLEDNVSGRSEIAFISTESDSVRVLKALPSNRLGGSPALSPDGRQLAFDVRDGTRSQRDVVVLDLDTGREEVVVADRADDAAMGWSPDGNELIFASDRRGSRDLFSLSIQHGVAAEPVLVRRDLRASEGAGVTDGGALFYSTRALESPALRVVAVEPGNATGGFREVDRVQRPMFWRIYPAWSHDGQQIAYVASRFEATSTPLLVIRAIDGQDERELRPQLAAFYDLRWSPDDRTIAVQADPLDGNSGAYLIDVMTGAVKRLEGVDVVRGWSSSGREVYFERPTSPAGDTTAIIARVLTTNAERELYRGPSGGPRRLAIAPDARAVYYRRSVAGSPSHDLVARDLGTGVERTLVRQQAVGALELSQDGRFITTPSDGGMLLVPVDGSPTRRLAGVDWVYWPASSSGMLAREAEVPGNQFQPPSYRWLEPTGTVESRLALPVGTKTVGDAVISPDGRRFAFVEREQLAAAPVELWVIDNFLPSPAVGQVTISVSTSRPSSVHPGFAGYNAALMSTGIAPGDPQLSAAAAALHPGWIRFPAGARANAYDWRTGQSRQEWVEQFRGNMFYGNLQSARQMLAAKGGEKIEDAAALADRLGARGLIVSVNVFTDTPQSAGEYATFVKARGIKVLVWQLANEPTFFPRFFPNARDYAEKMRPFADAIRAVDPAALISLSLSIAGNEDQGWDSSLAAVTPRYWDVLTYHHYPQLRAAEPDLVASLNEVLAREAAERVRSYVRPLFGNMPVIITEADPGSGSARPEASMVGTLYGGIWSAEYAMRLSTVPHVWHVGMHQLVGPAGIDVGDDHRRNLLAGVSSAEARFDYGLFMSAQGAAYSVASGVINAASASYPTAVSGGDSVALWSKGQSMPAIFAQAYRTDSGTALVVTNKGSRPQMLLIALDGVPARQTLRVLTVTGPAPHSRNGVNSARVVAREFVARDSVSIPPHSVTRIAWP